MEVICTKEKCKFKTEKCSCRAFHGEVNGGSVIVQKRSLKEICDYAVIAHTKEQLYSELVDMYGEQHQCLVCIEEMSELTKELVKYERGFEDLDQYEKIAEEIADVEIMLEQVKRIYDVEADVVNWKAEKLKRTRARLDELKKYV